LAEFGYCTEAEAPPQQGVDLGEYIRGHYQLNPAGAQGLELALRLTMMGITRMRQREKPGGVGE
jgi:hypothetical protein